VDATKRVLQSMHRSGETSRSAPSFSDKLRAREGRRYRLPHFGQAADIL
jgi:hypothetical protein